jgi:beta-galactosidase
VIGSRTPARVGVLFDWNNWWAIDCAVGPIQHKEYVPTVRRWYRALWRRNVAVDIVFSDSDLARYDVVIAPMLHMVKAGVADRVQALLERGGTFVATAFSGVVDDNDLAFEGYPGPLRPLLGVSIEEIDALYEGQTNRMLMAHGSASYSCSRLCEIVRPETAEVLATYGEDFYAGSPVLTRNRFGAGSAYYVASDPDDAFLDDFASRLLTEHAIQAPLAAPSGVEVAVRERDGQSLLFVLNHTPEMAHLELPPHATFRDLLREMPVSGTLALAPRDVRILTRTTPS